MFWSVTVSPATKNTRSEGADVTRMHRYLCANSHDLFIITFYIYGNLQVT